MSVSWETEQYRKTGPSDKTKLPGGERNKKMMLGDPADGQAFWAFVATGYVRQGYILCVVVRKGVVSFLGPGNS